MYFLRRCVFADSGFNNQESSYHIFTSFASVGKDFVTFPQFCLCFVPECDMLNAALYRKEGAPRWVGTAVFSSKKETLKLFRLEVRPFLGRRGPLSLLRRQFSQRESFRGIFFVMRGA